MRAGIWWVALGILTPLLAARACGSSSEMGSANDGGAAVADAPSESAPTRRIDSPSESTIEDSSMGGIDAGSDVGTDVALSCAPLALEGGLPALVPPRQPEAVCTLAQIQAYYAACFMNSNASCDAFYGDPNNSLCIRCMTTDSNTSPWGPVVEFRDNATTHANVEGCVAIIDQDAGPGSCAASVAASNWCRHNSCASVCPTGDTAAGLAAITQCQSEAALHGCQQYVQAAQCDQVPRYNSCIFVSFQSDVIGLGQFFCAASMDAGAPMEAGAPMDATSDAPGQ